MKRIFLISSILAWIVSLIALIIALTNLIPDNPLKEHSLIIGLGFICVSGFIGVVFKNLGK
jgi:hypothetical protein